MDTWVWIVIVAVVVLVAAAIVMTMLRQRRRRELQQRFGPEYERTVDSSPGRRQAERELLERERRHAELDLHPLRPSQRESYQREWNGLQARFVDRPQVAVADADGLVTQVMRDMGYPVEDFESQADLISVDHADVVARYREGHGIYAKTVEGTATTEDLRQAVISYRALFEELMRESAEAEPGA